MNNVTITQLEYDTLLTIKERWEKMEEYRKSYNQREDVVEKRKLYMKKRYEDIKKGLELLKSQGE